MNPLTLVKRIQKINSVEASLGVSEDASWHTKYKESAYVFVGGIPFDLTEGDLIAVFAQYGEIVDVNLVRDKGTGKSKGFAFLAYEDQRSTNLAVDNLNGASILGRTVRVDHVTNYKKKQEEDEEEEQEKREARGVCRAFQRGECNRGSTCKFSHNKQRCSNTGWGPKDDVPRWKHDKFDRPEDSRKSTFSASGRTAGYNMDESRSNRRSDRRDESQSAATIDSLDRESYLEPIGKNVNDHDRRGIEKQLERQAKKPSFKERENDGKWLGNHDSELNHREDRDRSVSKRPRHGDNIERRPGKHESDPDFRKRKDDTGNRKLSRHEEYEKLQYLRVDKHKERHEKGSKCHETAKLE